MKFKSNKYVNYAVVKKQGKDVLKNASNKLRCY